MWLVCLWSGLGRTFSLDVKDLQLALMFKVVIGHVAITRRDTGLELADNRKRANHRHKFWTRNSTISASKFSFTTRTVQNWKYLLAAIVKAELPAAFKAGPVRHFQLCTSGTTHSRNTLRWGLWIIVKTRQDWQKGQRVSVCFALILAWSATNTVHFERGWGAKQWSE